ncbi:MAG: histidine kinase [Nitrospirae bacterium]|nr:histidine kinase [Nitrospirota bacterium]
MRKTVMRKLWMPASILLLGMLAGGLLLWTKRINEKERMNYMTDDAIMHMQMHTVTFHLHLDELIAGQAGIEMRDLRGDLDRTVVLIDAILHGGEAEHGVVLAALTGPEARRQAEKTKALLLQFRKTADEHLQGSGRPAISTAVDRRFEELYRKIFVEAHALEKIVDAEKVRIQAKSRSLFVGILAVWALVVGVFTLGLSYKEARRRAADKALHEANERLEAQAGELREHREHLAEIVGKRTEELKAANESLSHEIAEHMCTEEVLMESRDHLRRLSKNILSAQETERRRIARELHDQLGQDLTLMKLQVRAIQREVREEREPVREDCEDVLQSLDPAIENVRRISRPQPGSP